MDETNYTENPDDVVRRLNEINSEGGPSAIHRAICNDEIVLLDADKE